MEEMHVTHYGLGLKGAQALCEALKVRSPLEEAVVVLSAAAAYK